MRVALLDAGKVAVTNMVSPEPMHGIIDRTLQILRRSIAADDHYSDVPLGSLAWLIDRIPNKPDNVQLPGGFAITLPAIPSRLARCATPALCSLRADVFAQSEAQARQIVDSANSHLALVRSIGQFIRNKGPDQDVKAAFDSIQVDAKRKCGDFHRHNSAIDSQEDLVRSSIQGAIPASQP